MKFSISTSKTLYILHEWQAILSTEAMGGVENMNTDSNEPGGVCVCLQLDDHE